MKVREKREKNSSRQKPGTTRKDQESKLFKKELENGLRHSHNENQLLPRKKRALNHIPERSPPDQLCAPRDPISKNLCGQSPLGETTERGGGKGGSVLQDMCLCLPAKKTMAPHSPGGSFSAGSLQGRRAARGDFRVTPIVNTH